MQWKVVYTRIFVYIVCIFVYIVSVYLYILCVLCVYQSHDVQYFRSPDYSMMTILVLSYSVCTQLGRNVSVQ